MTIKQRMEKCVKFAPNKQRFIEGVLGLNLL